MREMFSSPLPSSIDILIVGGGIHGAGVLHDLASRGFGKMHLIEKSVVGSGTSSRSTKLIHGGLRYLKQPTQVSLVADSLRERGLLLKLIPEIVTPIEILVPIKSMAEKVFTRVGLAMYDILSRGEKVGVHRSLSLKEAEKKIPHVDFSKFSHVLSYWDAQTDDFELVRTVARSAEHLGAKITENCRVIRFVQEDDHWNVTVVRNGQEHAIQARYIVNCAGPWAHEIFQGSEEIPRIKGINNKGSHLLFPDLSFQSGVLMRSPKDGRYMFILPWRGLTLVGTTEEAFEKKPDSVRVDEKEIDYLLQSFNHYLKVPVGHSDILGSFSGLRWLVAQGKDNLSAFSRESVLEEQGQGRAKILTVYGGKLTSYRKLSEEIADKVLKHFSIKAESRTAEKSMWVRPAPQVKGQELLDRFASL